MSTINLLMPETSLSKNTLDSTCKPETKINLLMKEYTLCSGRSRYGQLEHNGDLEVACDHHFHCVDICPKHTIGEVRQGGINV